jgi:RimJ/RimL family protein N-acetyltransferase
MLRIPQLTTDRLLLRAFAPEDFEPYAQMMANSDVTRYLGEGHPLSRVEAWRQLAMFAGHWVLRGFGPWAVEERATGRFLGRIGCLEPEGFPAFEIAYTLAPEAWGKGYAREGAAAALRYARETLRRTAITSIIRPANVASIRVAQSLGAVAAETVEFFGAPSVLYRYPQA